MPNRPQLSILLQSEQSLHPLFSNSQYENKLWVLALTKCKNVGAGPNRERLVTTYLVRPAQFKNHRQALKTEI